MPDRATLVQDLAALLRASLRLAPPSPALTEVEPLFGGRLPLDSVDSLQWALAVEQRFNIELSDDEIAAGALETLGQMANTLVARGVVSGSVKSSVGGERE